MPTFGWILEADTDAQSERERIIDSPAPPKPAFQCPFCSRAFYAAKNLDKHVSAEHYAKRPFVLFDGRELSAASVRRNAVDASSIHFANACESMVRINGGTWERVSIDDLRKRLASMRRETVEIRLLNSPKYGDASGETYRIDFRIATATALERVEMAFREFVQSRALSLDRLRNFIDDIRCEGEGFDYARALGDFLLGIFRKEAPSSKNLTTPSRLYREDYVRAGEILKEIERPLARLVVQLIRFGLNDFAARPFNTGYVELDTSCNLLHDQRQQFVAPNRNGIRYHLCPVDHDTSRLINLAVRMARQARWSELLSNECRDVARSSLLETVDRQKAYAIWAACAWRLECHEAAMEPLRAIATIYPFDRWATPLIEAL